MRFSYINEAICSYQHNNYLHSAPPSRNKCQDNRSGLFDVTHNSCLTCRRRANSVRECRLPHIRAHAVPIRRPTRIDFPANFTHPFRTRALWFVFITMKCPSHGNNGVWVVQGCGLCRRDAIHYVEIVCLFFSLLLKNMRRLLKIVLETQSVVYF